jgi:hypothetical protein
MNCKLTINLNTGHLEVEGSEELVREIYHDFKILLEKVPVKANENNDSDDSNHDGTVVENVEVPTTKSKKSKSTRAKTSSSPKASSDMVFLNDLNLRPKGKESLKDFAAKYQIKTSEELSLLIVYYLKEELKEAVTLAHIFTCLKELGKKIPTHLKQVLSNNKNNKHWIDLNDWNDIKYTVAGMNYMEHDFTKA